jgi:hypothetical protein
MMHRRTKKLLRNLPDVMVSYSGAVPSHGQQHRAYHGANLSADSAPVLIWVKQSKRSFFMVA